MNMITYVNMIFRLVLIIYITFGIESLYFRNNSSQLSAVLVSQVSSLLVYPFQRIR